MKKPNVKEAEILSSVKKILDLFKMQGLLTYRRIHVMPVQIGSGRWRPNNDMQGMEDLQISMINGRTIHLELKSTKGKLSDKQKERQSELLALGHDYLVCNNIDDFLLALRQRGLAIWSVPS